MPRDILDKMIKESWIYEQWKREVFAHAFQQGVEQGAQQMFVWGVEALFAPLTSLAQEASAVLKTPEKLELVIGKIIHTQSEEEAQGFLLAARNGEIDIVKESGVADVSLEIACERDEK